MSDLVLRAIGQAICLSTVGTFVFVMSLVTISATASSSEYCYTKRCGGTQAQHAFGLSKPDHVAAVPHAIRKGAKI